MKKDPQLIANKILGATPFSRTAMALFISVVLSSSVGKAAEAKGSVESIEKKRSTQSERWSLDFELANEISMSTITNRRFSSVEQRAAWVDQIAGKYSIADTLRHLIDFKTGKSTPNENLYSELVEAGQKGDISAACLAWFMYGQFDRTQIKNWRYNYDDVTRIALRFKDSGHPVCKNIVGYVHLYGLLGNVKDSKKAKPYMIKEAKQGYFGSQMYMALTHLQSTGRTNEFELARELCWRRLADAQSESSRFNALCNQLKQGYDFDENSKTINVNSLVISTARAWCRPTNISPEAMLNECVNLENIGEAK